MTSWIEEELKSLNLGDERLNARTKVVLEGLSNSPQESIPRCFPSWSETLACYRLFDNDRVTAAKLLSPHREATFKRMENEKVVLSINDTTSIDFTDKHSIEGLGTLEREFTRGLWLHPTIAITPERVCLGMIRVDIWARSNPVKHRSLNSNVRNNTPIEKKESYRWIQSYYSACELAEQLPNTQVISIADRESDIMELLLAAQEKRFQGRAADVIIRSHHDRRVVNKNGTASTLRQVLQQTPICGENEFVLHPRDEKQKRKVRQAIKAIEVTLSPKRIKGKTFEAVKINVVMAEEVNPPEGEEKICWIILTTLPVDSLENILRIIDFYLCRWEIEIFFKVLKSGCEVEERSLRNTNRLENMIALFMLVAWRVMYVMMVGRECPQVSCEAIFKESEWKSVYKICNKKLPVPDTPLLLGELVKMIAILGGYLNRTNDPPPGPKIMWRGMQRAFDFALAWETFCCE